MAKTKTDGGHRPNRIRFVMLDADLSDGNLSELTQAITNALRPATASRVVEHRAALAPVAPRPAEGTAEADDDEGDEGIPEAQANVSPRTPRKLPLPKYLDDLEMNGNGTSFKDFITQTPAKKHLRRYLVASYWLKEHGGHEVVNADMVFTCYRTAGWPTNVRDWDANFRAHVRTDKMRRIKAGEYKITPVGEDSVRKGDAE